MTVAGIDIGGTKIEIKLFDRNWIEIAKRRTDTPRIYADLVAEVVALIRWAEEQTGGLKAIGIGAAGLVTPGTGIAVTANLVATGLPFPADIAAAAGRKVTYVNDCRSLALSEAVFGAGKGKHCVMALIIGTGIGGGIAIDQTLRTGPTTTGGEFGHIAAPAHLIAEHSLPLVACGCGRVGCIETFVAGPGLERLAHHLTGQSLTVPEITDRKGGEMREVWTLWCALAGEMIHGLTLTADPDIIVLGGGLSAVPGITDDLMEAAAHAQIADFGAVPIVLAEGGDASGARGAAYAAWQDWTHD